MKTLYVSIICLLVSNVLCWAQSNYMPPSNNVVTVYETDGGFHFQLPNNYYKMDTQYVYLYRAEEDSIEYQVIFINDPVLQAADTAYAFPMSDTLGMFVTQLVQNTNGNLLQYSTVTHNNNSIVGKNCEIQYISPDSGILTRIFCRFYWFDHKIVILTIQADEVHNTLLTLKMTNFFNSLSFD